MYHTLYLLRWRLCLGPSIIYDCYVVSTYVFPTAASPLQSQRIVGVQHDVDLLADAI